MAHSIALPVWNCNETFYPRKISVKIKGLLNNCRLILDNENVIRTVILVV